MNTASVNKHPLDALSWRAALILAGGLVWAALPAAARPLLIFGAEADISGGTNPNYPEREIAVYGSEALSGLVNFIINDDFDGADFNPTFDLRVATGDVNGDGTPDIITAPGAGSLGVGLPGPKVHAYDGITHNLIEGFSYHPYGPGYIGGVTVASGGDFDQDGIADIVNGTDLNGSPQFRVFSGVDQTLLGTFSNNLGLGFAGEVNVDIADFNDDGVPDIIASAGGNVALIETGFNPSGQPTWNPLAAPSHALFGDAFTDEINLALIRTPTSPGGEDRPLLLAISSAGHALVDVSDPANPTNVNFNFPFGDLTGSDIAPGDYDGDGEDDISVYRPTDNTWYLLRSNSSNSVTATAQQTFNPFGAGIGGTVATARTPDVRSRPTTVTPDQLSTGTGDTTPGAFKGVDLFTDINLKIFATDNAAVGKSFDVHSLNLFAADNVQLPDGVRLLPRTRALFVETDAPNGSVEAEIYWFFNADNLQAILAALDAEVEDVRLAHVFATGTTDVQYTLTVIDTVAGAVFREYSNPLGTTAPATTDTEAFATVDQFSGYALVVIPEPSSLALLGLGGLALIRRRRSLWLARP